MAHLPLLNPTKNSRNPHNPPLMKPPSNESLTEARRRIADCFHGRDRQGRLIQRRDALNLAGLGLTAEEVEERFDLWQRGLESVGFEDLVHLRYLDLTSNQLTRLPRGTGGFRKLRWLGLNFNRLGSIADEAGDWTDLEKLYLRGNSLETLPEAVATWTRLVEVDLTGNESLKSLPHAWLDALAQRNASQDGASPIVVELAGSGLDLEYRRQTKSKLTRDNFHEGPVREWLRKQEHTPDEFVRRHDPFVRRHDPPPHILLLLYQWGEETTADALISLSRKNQEWLVLLEEPKALSQRTWDEQERLAIATEVKRIQDGREQLELGHSLWRSWYVSGLRRQREKIKALGEKIRTRLRRARSPGSELSAARSEDPQAAEASSSDMQKRRDSRRSLGPRGQGATGKGLVP